MFGFATVVVMFITAQFFVCLPRWLRGALQPVASQEPMMKAETTEAPTMKTRTTDKDLEANKEWPEGGALPAGNSKESLIELAKRVSTMYDLTDPENRGEQEEKQAPPAPKAIVATPVAQAGQIESVPSAQSNSSAKRRIGGSRRVAAGELPDKAPSTEDATKTRPSWRKPKNEDGSLPDKGASNPDLPAKGDSKSSLPAKGTSNSSLLPDRGSSQKSLTAGRVSNRSSRRSPSPRASGRNSKRDKATAAAAAEEAPAEAPDDGEGLAMNAEVSVLV